MFHITQLLGIQIPTDMAVLVETNPQILGHQSQPLRSIGVSIAMRIPQ